MTLLDGLTERECDILRHVYAGLSNKQIARALAIREGTVKVHLHNMFIKLSVANRTQLATLLHRLQTELAAS